MNLQDFFRQNPRIAVAFSGGADSAYLLHEAVRSGAQVRAYYAKSSFQPAFELADAERMAGQLGADLTVLALDVLADEQVRKNPENRCYYCKKQIFSAILQAAAQDGFPVLCDGTNASDDVADRPGFRALQELRVCSPLRDAGLTKPEIRRLSGEAGLFTWDKPAYACLATRIPAGSAITQELLQRTEAAEGYLMEQGFSDFRIRLMGDAARIQLPEGQAELLWQRRQEILTELKKHYSAVLLDLEVRGE